jgi:hypothetical protein
MGFVPQPILPFYFRVLGDKLPHKTLLSRVFTTVSLIFLDLWILLLHPIHIKGQIKRVRSSTCKIFALDGVLLTHFGLQPR